jgi:hypothetical protein
MPVIATPATPPQPLAMVKVGYQPWDGSDLLHVKATKKKPRATAGLKLNEVELMKGTDLLKVGPATLVAGSLVDRNAGLRWMEGPRLHSLM